MREPSKRHRTHTIPELSIYDGSTDHNNGTIYLRWQHRTQQRNYLSMTAAKNTTTELSIYDGSTEHNNGTISIYDGNREEVTRRSYKVLAYSTIIPQHLFRHFSINSDILPEQQQTSRRKNKNSLPLPLPDRPTMTFRWKMRNFNEKQRHKTGTSIQP
jgi:hypothetical protein